MIYAVYKAGETVVSLLEAWDGDIVAAPPAWHYLIGFPVEALLVACRRQGYQWRVRGR